MICFQCGHGTLDWNIKSNLSLSEIVHMWCGCIQYDIFHRVNQKYIPWVLFKNQKMPRLPLRPEVYNHNWYPQSIRIYVVNQPIKFYRIKTTTEESNSEVGVVHPICISFLWPFYKSAPSISLLQSKGNHCKLEIYFPAIYC